MSFDNRSSTMDGNGSNPEMQSQSPLCKAGCGFYGSAMLEGLCSKCHKDKVKRLQPTPSSQTPSVAHGPSPTVQTDARSLPPSSSLSSSSLSSSLASSNVDVVLEASGGTDSSVESKAAASNVSVQTSSDKTEEKVPDSDDTASTASEGVEASTAKPKKNRCLVCNKKVGLTGFGCRCGGLFCSTHRYSDLHDCAFDYKEHAQGQIRKNNPVVVGNKITKI